MRLEPIIPLTLEDSLAYISTDEYVENHSEKYQTEKDIPYWLRQERKRRKEIIYDVLNNFLQTILFLCLAYQ